MYYEILGSEMQILVLVIGRSSRIATLDTKRFQKFCESWRSRFVVLVRVRVCYLYVAMDTTLYSRRCTFVKIRWWSTSYSTTCLFVYHLG